MEMKEAVTKVIDTLTREDFHGAFQSCWKRYNKCIAAGGDYLEGDKSFMCVLSIKVPIRKKSGNLSYAPRIATFLQWYQNYHRNLILIFPLFFRFLEGNILTRLPFFLELWDISVSYSIVYFIFLFKLY